MLLKGAQVRDSMLCQRPMSNRRVSSDFEVDDDAEKLVAPIHPAGWVCGSVYANRTFLFDGERAPVLGLFVLSNCSSIVEHVSINP